MLPRKWTVCSGQHLIIGLCLPSPRASLKRARNYEYVSLTAHKGLSQGPESHSWEMQSLRRMRPLAPSLCGRIDSSLPQLTVSKRSWSSRFYTDRRFAIFTSLTLLSSHSCPSLILPLKRSSRLSTNRNRTQLFLDCQ